jgi:hypothetical protein
MITVRAAVRRGRAAVPPGRAGRNGRARAPREGRQCLAEILARVNP